jgi:hypothetical protein
MSTNEVDAILDIVIDCPHCKGPIIIEKLNCCIFRHGIIKQSGQQMNPHASKEECDSLFNSNAIFGCGKPFKIIICEGKYIVEICDYI